MKPKDSSKDSILLRSGHRYCKCCILILRAIGKIGLMSKTTIDKMVDGTTRVQDTKWTTNGQDILRALVVAEKGAIAPALIRALSTDVLHLIATG